MVQSVHSPEASDVVEAGTVVVPVLETTLVVDAPVEVEVTTVVTVVLL